MMTKRWRRAKGAFWNAAGLENKEKAFWKEIEESKKMRHKLPRGYSLVAQWTRKTSRKGRAIGGMMVGVRNEGNGEKRETRGMEKAAHQVHKGLWNGVESSGGLRKWRYGMKNRNDKWMSREARG